MGVEFNYAYLRECDTCIMNYKDYIKERLDDQIEWYSQKSGTAQKWYKRLSISSYIGAGLITILSLLVIEYAFIKYCISILGVAIGVIASIKNLYKYHDNWISYRYTSELLKQEKYMFLNQAGVYNISDDSIRQRSLVERCETIISHETINWTNLQSKEDKAKV